MSWAAATPRAMHRDHQDGKLLSDHTRAVQDGQSNPFMIAKVVLVSAWALPLNARIARICGRRRTIS